MSTLSSPAPLTPLAPAEIAASVEVSAAWLALKSAAEALHPLQAADGSIPDAAHHAAFPPRHVVKSLSRVEFTRILRKSHT